MMRCFYHPQCGDPDLCNGKSVLLLCDCLVSICQRCAQDQVAASAQIRNPQVVCPKCKYEIIYKTHGCVHNVEDAIAMEVLLVRRAAAYAQQYGIINTNCFTIDALGACLAVLLQSFPHLQSEVHGSLNAMNNSAEQLDLYLRFSIAGVAHKAFPDDALPHPYKMLSFARNMVLERHLYSLTNFSGAQGRVGSCKCFRCMKVVTPGHSVQLTCECDINLCRDCALSGIAYQADTYNTGIQCPQCQRISRGVLKDTTCVENYEESLLYLLQQYITFTVAHVPEGSARKSNFRYHRLILLYNSLGYRGSILNAGGLARASVLQLRLEAARLEEMRLNNMGLLNTYSWTSATISPPGSEEPRINARGPPIGVLHALAVKKNVFFEHLYLNQSAEAVAQPTPQITALRAQAVELSRDLRYNRKSLFDLPAKLITMAMILHEAPQKLAADSCEDEDNDVKYTNHSVCDVIKIVGQCLLSSPSAYVRSYCANWSPNLLDPFLEKFTAREVTRLLDKLDSAGVVHNVYDCDGNKALFSLRNWRKVVAYLDPAHRRVVEAHLASASPTSTAPPLIDPIPAAARPTAPKRDFDADPAVAAAAEGSKRTRISPVMQNVLNAVAAFASKNKDAVSSTAAAFLLPPQPSAAAVNSAPVSTSTSTESEPELTTAPPADLSAHFTALKRLVSDAMKEAASLRAENARLQELLSLSQSGPAVPSAEKTRALRLQVKEMKQTNKVLRAQNKSVQKDLKAAEEGCSHAVAARDSLMRTVAKLREENRRLKDDDEYVAR